MKHFFRLGSFFLIVGIIVVCIAGGSGWSLPLLKPTLDGDGIIQEKEYDYQEGLDIVFNFHTNISKEYDKIKLTFNKEATKIKIKSDSNILEKIAFTTNGENVFSSDFRFRPTNAILITVPDVESKIQIDSFVEVVEARQPLTTSKNLVVNGALDGELTVKDIALFKVKVNGACELELKGNINQIEVNTNGALDLKVSGTTNYLLAETNGALELEAIDLIAKKMKLSINGAVSAEVNVIELLDVKTKGIGDIRYKGNPEIKKNGNGILNISQIS